MFEMKLKTYYKDGREVETSASAEHFVAFEEHFGEPLVQAMNVGKLTHFYYLGWLTSSSGIEFKDWIATVRDVDPVGAEDAVPFEKAATEGSSPT